MKHFACGDVVPGCDASFVGVDDRAILDQVAAHAAHVHALPAVSDELVGAVVGAIRSA